MSDEFIKIVKSIQTTGKEPDTNEIALKATIPTSKTVNEGLSPSVKTYRLVANAHKNNKREKP